MILFLVTCINPGSDNSDEWDKWTYTTNSNDSDYLIRTSGNDKLIVINGQQFDYNAIYTQFIEFIDKLDNKLKEITTKEKIQLSKGDIVAIHYGGGSLSHEYMQKHMPALVFVSATDSNGRLQQVFLPLCL